jgi:hypothetical protein
VCVFICTCSVCVVLFVFHYLTHTHTHTYTHAGISLCDLTFPSGAKNKESILTMAALPEYRLMAFGTEEGKLLMTEYDHTP